MNNSIAFYESALLHMLYLRNKPIPTKELEAFLAKHHPQRINNIISDRDKKTSYIYKGYIKHDDKVKDNATLSITEKGKKFIEDQYANRRKS